MSRFISPAIKDVWAVARVVWVTLGFGLGLTLYTYSAFLYQKFAPLGNHQALKLTVWTSIIMDITILLMEVPTGAMADHFGRKKVLIASFALCATTYFFRAWMPFVSSLETIFILAALSSIFYALSFTLYSGCCTAWMVDTIHERNIPEGHGPLLARSWEYLFLAQIAGAVIGLTLYLTGYIFYAFALGFIASLLCALFCLIVMQETQSMKFHKGELSFVNSFKEMLQIVKEGSKISLKTPIVLYLMIIAATFKFLNDLIGYLMPVAMQANFGTGKANPYWFAVVFAGLSMGLLGSKLLGKLNKKQKNTKLSNASLWLWFVSINFLVAFAVIILGLNSIKQPMPLFLLIVTISICKFGYGFLTPAYGTLVNSYIPKQNSKQRATILSLGNMLISLLAIFLMLPSSGPNGQSTAVGWMMPGTLLLVLTIVIHILVRRYQRKIGEIPLRISPLTQES